MSAFMCSDKHLSVLACYIVRHNLDLTGESDEPLGLREARVFRTLARENCKSLDARYPGDNNFDTEAMCRLDPSSRFLAASMAPVALIKLCHCYAYQSCEHKGWQDSRAKGLVDGAESHAVRALPGYSDAPWGL